MRYIQIKGDITEKFMNPRCPYITPVSLMSRLGIEMRAEVRLISEHPQHSEGIVDLECAEHLSTPH